MRGLCHAYHRAGGAGKGLQDRHCDPVCQITPVLSTLFMFRRLMTAYACFSPNALMCNPWRMWRDGGPLCAAVHEIEYLSSGFRVLGDETPEPSSGGLVPVERWSLSGIGCRRASGMSARRAPVERDLCAARGPRDDGGSSPLRDPSANALARLAS